NTRSELIASDGETSVIHFSINAYRLTKVTTPQGEAFFVETPGCSRILKSGAPDLPKLTKSVIIPDDAEMTVEINRQEFIEIDGISIAPSKGNLLRTVDPSTVPFSYGNEYSTDAFFPAVTATLSDPYIFRDYRGQTVIVNPLQYNPVSKTLRIYTDLTVTIRPTGNLSVVNPYIRSKAPGKTSSEFGNIYKRHFMNYQSGIKYTQLSDIGNILVVCHTSYMTAILPYIEWKKQKGIPTELVEFSTIGTTAAELKTYVENYYNTNGLTFLLLVGDGEDIPSITSGVAGDSDVAYGYLLGSDAYPELIVGRFSANNVAHVETQVGKTIFYEKDMETDADWLEYGTGIASDEGGSGQGDDGESDAAHIGNIRTDLLSYGYVSVDEIYDPGATDAQLATAVNAGRGIINYCGHGGDFSFVTTGFDVTDVNNLNNENMLPFIFDVACVNGNFHGQTCFAEAWLRANSGGKYIGAIAMIGSTINQSWDPPMDGQDEMNDILMESYTDNIKRSFGGLVVNGCGHMNDEYGSGGADMTDTWTTFGDPSIMVRTKTPQAMTVAHNSTISIGETQFTVNCSAEDALVALTIDGEIIGTGYISGGSVTIDLDPAPSNVGTMLVTVTGYNQVTYQGDVLIIVPSGPYVIHYGYSVNDAAGNNNGLPDYNETIAINHTLKNVGVAQATGITATLSS
ncbi:MAG: gingipain R, partial [Bacteroidetes bacterium]|nr:gingipain R [Bacteroidota bacterium]